MAVGQKPLVTRIGVHTGRVLVGNIGASERMNYTIVGDAVNTTARLEGIRQRDRRDLVYFEQHTRCGADAIPLA